MEFKDFEIMADRYGFKPKDDKQYYSFSSMFSLRDMPPPAYAPGFLRECISVVGKYFDYLLEERGVEYKDLPTITSKDDEYRKKYWYAYNTKGGRRALAQRYGVLIDSSDGYLVLMAWLDAGDGTRITRRNILDHLYSKGIRGGKLIEKTMEEQQSYWNVLEKRAYKKRQQQILTEARQNIREKEIRKQKEKEAAQAEKERAEMLDFVKQAKANIAAGQPVMQHSGSQTV